MSVNLDRVLNTWKDIITRHSDTIPPNMRRIITATIVELEEFKELTKKGKKVELESLKEQK